jgi:hypothetical protein
MMLGLDDIHELTTKMGLTELEVIIFGATFQYQDFRIADEAVSTYH